MSSTFTWASDQRPASGDHCYEVRRWNKGSARGSGPERALGTVRVRTAPLVRCDDCGGWMTGGIRQGEHSPHRRQVGGRWCLVNCVGLVLRHGEEAVPA